MCDNCLKLLKENNKLKDEIETLIVYLGDVKERYDNLKEKYDNLKENLKIDCQKWLFLSYI